MRPSAQIGIGEKRVGNSVRGERDGLVAALPRDQRRLPLVATKSRAVSRLDRGNFLEHPVVVDILARCAIRDRER